MPNTPEPITAVIARRLKAEREKKNLSQTALADRAGVDRKTVHRIEHGHFSPNMETFILLCDALKLDPNALLSDR
ncbi:MAG: XRE family transcriptional regulator [Actinobacteria bacterium]|nr:XRE family transcriptional regulator [Actinomycetota bacterium]